MTPRRPPIALTHRRRPNLARPTPASLQWAGSGRRSLHSPNVSDAGNRLAGLQVWLAARPKLTGDESG